MRNFLRWTMGTLVLAGLAHIAVILSYPRIAMNELMTQVEAQAGGTNRAVYPDRPDHTARRVVRPSPDLFYALCVFDVTKGPVHVRAPVADAYWSLSFYAANSDNFYVVSKASGNAKQINVVLARQGTDVTDIPYSVLTPPTRRGIALFRMLIDPEEPLAALDKVRKQTDCRPLGE